jgi:hypothetical protein
MIIANANIQMTAQHDYREERSVRERLEFWVGDRLANTRAGSETEQESPSVKVDFSSAGSVLAMHRQRQVLDLSPPMDSRSRLNLMILEAMYKAITGREMQVTAPGDLQAKGSGGVQSLSVDGAPSAQAMARAAGPGLVYERQERYVEQERMSFNAVGTVRTADGREIDFSVALNMSREFIQESNLEIRAGSAVKIDPLVINFDGLGVGLTQTRFEFDLDSDGTAEQIASLRPGNGYLALDRNGDGIINNGSELFGPTTGRGFAELAAFDEDGNNFIDEADSIYHQLRIWMINEDGSTQLTALGDKNIGAIYLGHVSSPFQLKGTDNQSLGEVANSSVYLTEDGKVGVVQEINLTV